MRNSFVIECDIRVPVNRVFQALISAEDLKKWHHAGDGWKTPYAEVDARMGGKIKIGYSNADDTESFEFTAVISEINAPVRLVYYLQIEDLINQDNRMVTYDLEEKENLTHLRAEIDLENINDKDLQIIGWTQHYEFLKKFLEEK